jgi:hypothetical protein
MTTIRRACTALLSPLLIAGCFGAPLQSSNDALASSVRPVQRYETPWRRLGLIPISSRPDHRSEDQLLIDVISFEVGTFGEGLK